MMFISGIGFISGEGIGLEALRKSFAQPLLKEIDDDIIKSYSFPRGMRRADRFSRLCMIAGNEAVKDSGLEMTEECGIIVATALGPHETTFAFLEDIIDYSTDEVSPTKFSHSVHNAAASYTSIYCGIKGLSMTVVDFENPWAKALLTAEVLIEQGQAERILLVGADEKKLLAELLENLDRPDFPDDSLECAVGMLLTAEKESGSYCKMSAVRDDDYLIFTKNSGETEKLPKSYSGNVFFGNAIDCVVTALR